MFVQVEKGLKLHFISLHQKGLQLTAVFHFEVVKGWAKLVWSEIVSDTLGILEDPGVEVLLIDLLEALDHIRLRFKPWEVHPPQVFFIQLLGVVIVNWRPWGRESVPPPDSELIDKVVMVGIGDSSDIL